MGAPQYGAAVVKNIFMNIYFPSWILCVDSENEDLPHEIFVHLNRWGKCKHKKQAYLLLRLTFKFACCVVTLSGFLTTAVMWWFSARPWSITHTPVSPVAPKKAILILVTGVACGEIFPYLEWRYIIWQVHANRKAKPCEDIATVTRFIPILFSLLCSAL